MAQKRGRPPTPLDPTASHGAQLGYVLRTSREDAGLTLEQLADRIGFTPQRISDVERAKATPSQPFLAACEDALDDAAGKLLPLLPDVQRERDEARQARADARRAARQTEAESALPCPPTHCEAGHYDEDLDPTNRRGLIETGAAAALGISLLGIDAAPTRAGDIDPELPAHLTRLLCLFGRHDAAFGPHEVLDAVRYEIGRIATHRKVARGELATELMRVEARWAQFAAWLSNDAGQADAREAWADWARRLALEAGYADMVAFIHVRRSQWAAQRADARYAVDFAEAAIRVPGISEQTRARSVLRLAYGHALAHNAIDCERSLAQAEATLECAGPPLEPPWVGRATIRTHVRPDEARCWLTMNQPGKAIPLYEDVLRDWPRARVRDRGLHQARLAVACADAGELDRAEAEGRRARAITRTTKSSGATRELRRLRQALEAV